MLSGRLPTGSIETRETGPPRVQSPTADRTRADYERRIEELEATVATLEAELDRRDDERQEMIDRYEWTLEAKRRAHRNAREERTSRRVETPGPPSLRERVGAALSRLGTRLDPDGT